MRYFLPTLFAFGLAQATHAQVPSLNSLYAQTECTDLDCMNAYARSLNYCLRPVVEDWSHVWTDCTGMDIPERSNTISYFSMITDGKMTFGYSLSTSTEAYANTLALEIEGLGLTRTDSTASAVSYVVKYSRPGDDRLVLVRTKGPIEYQGKKDQRWIFLFIVKRT